MSSATTSDELLRRVYGMGDIVVFGARLSSGLLAGLYFAFAVAVMPALRGLDDVNFVDAMKRINVSIVNPFFMMVFFAAPLLTAAAALLVRSPLVWTAAALGIVTLLITVMINVPLNNRLAAGGTRSAFAQLWVLSNAVRTIAGIGCFACLLLFRTTMP